MNNNILIICHLNQVILIVIILYKNIKSAAKQADA